MPDRFGAVGIVPGTGVAVVARQFVALVDDDPRGSTVKLLWACATAGVPFDEVLDELGSAGIRSLPSFVVVAPESGDLRIVARGAVVATVAGPIDDAPSTVDPAGSLTWVDRLVPRGHITLTLDGDLSELGPFVTLGGVLPACRLEADLSDPADPTEPADPIAEPAGILPPIAAVPAPTAEAASDQVDDLAEVADEGRPTEHEIGADAAPVDLPGPDAADASLSGDTAVFTDMLGDATVTGHPPHPTPAFYPPPLPSPPPSPLPSANTQADLTGAPLLIAPAAEPEAAPDPDSYDSLFGATQFRSVEDAAVRASASTDDDHAPPAAAHPLAPPSTPAAIVVPKVPTGPPPAELAGDHDGLTIGLAALQAMRAASTPAAGADPAASAANAIGAPMVHAIVCPGGHLNPTHSTTCRTCAATIGDQAQITVPRPVLGQFRFSTGAVETLDRPMLIGRAPRIDGSVTGQPPQLVVVPSADREISGTHVEIRLEGWQVLVVDRASTNGTTIRVPGRAPQRIRAGEPFPITPGTSVSLADEVDFTFEAAP